MRNGEGNEVKMMRLKPLKCYVCVGERSEEVTQTAGSSRRRSVLLGRLLTQLLCDAYVRRLVQHALSALRANVVGPKHLVDDLVVLSEAAVRLSKVAVIFVRDSCHRNTQKT